MSPTYTPVEMIQKALSVCHPRQLAHANSAGGVACALESISGRLYYGVCIDISSGIGFCAEHSAIAAMITARESGIKQIVAVVEGGQVLPPCGRCREFIAQIDDANLGNTQVILAPDKVVRLAELLPYPYC